MPCYYEKTDYGQTFLCGDLGSPCQCGWVADSLCDYPVGDDKTCDRLMCENCAEEISPNIHYCYEHNKQWEFFVEQGGVNKVLENVTPFKCKENAKNYTR